MDKIGGFVVALALTLPVQVWAQGPPLYVSTGAGHQILKVDGTTGATTVLFTDQTVDPEGMAVGPDGRIWITDPTNGQVDVLNQDGSNFQGVYFGAPGVSPSGPTFDSAGDLFFNSKGNSTGTQPSGVFKIFAAAEWGSNPHCCVVGNILPATTVGSFQGEGTALTQHGQLLIVDRSGSRVLLYVPSGPVQSVLLIPNQYLSGPVGISVDSVNRILVAYHDGHEIWRFDESGSFLDSYTILSGTEDYPYYMQFDASGNLYVVTADSTGTANGKIWKVPACGVGPCSASLLVDLGLAYTMGTVPGLASGGAIGVAAPLVEAAPQVITAGTPATFDLFNYQAAFTYPADATIPAGTTMRTLGIPLLPADFAALRLANSAFADTSCLTPPSPCVVFRTQCFSGGSQVSCPAATASADIGVQITVPPNSCTPIQSPALLEAHDDQNNWMNIFRTAMMSAPDTNNLCTQTVAGATQAFTSDFVVTHRAFAPAGTLCGGGPGHEVLPPIDADGTSVFKQGSTVPAKFRVCLPDDLGASIGPRATVPTVVAAFQLVQVIPGTPSGPTESATSTTPDTAFRWDATNQQWIFNISTKTLTANNTYVFLVTLSDGSAIQFQFGLK